MYSVYLDQQLIHDLDSEDNVLISPTLNLELNKAGTFEFSMECTHPFYDKLEAFKSIIQVLCDGDEIFKGRIIEITDDMYKERKVYCESELAYLNDTIQRPYEFHLAANAVVEYLNLVIGSHNEQVDDARQFELGMITVNDPNDYIYCYTNYNSTMDEIKEDLVDDLGGYIRVRNVYANDNPLGTLQHRYIDYIYLEEYGNTSTQYIEFGENLLDFSNDVNQADICTGIIPLGATLEESEYSAIEERVTIKSVNDDVDYLVITDAVAKYGLILKVVTWDDITEPGNLKTAGENYLAEYNYEPQTIEATAVDMHLTDEQIMAWRLGDMVFVESEPHDVHARYPLAQMQIPLDSPENTSVTLGTYEDVSLTARTNKTESGLRNMEDFTTGNIIASAVAQATNILNGAIHGYVTLNLDDDGHPYELLIMDTESTDTATKVWRWNMGGLGYSSTGYNKEESAYTTAITMDGHILGTLIIANGMVLADDSDATFGKFDDDGMKVYQQAGKDDILLLSVGSNGLVAYDTSGGIRTRLNTDGLEFWYGGERTCYMYADGGHYLRINDINRFAVGSDSDAGWRTLLLENQTTGIELMVADDSAGTAGLLDVNSGLWMVASEAESGTVYLGTGYADTIIRGTEVTVNSDISCSGTIAVNNSNGHIRLSNTNQSRGLQDVTNNEWPLFYSTVAGSYYFGAIYYPTTIRGTSITLYNDTNAQGALTVNNETVATQPWVLDQIPDLSGYALKSDIPSNVSAFTNDAGYMTRDDTCGVTFQDGYTGANGTFNTSFSFNNGLICDLTSFFDSVFAARGGGGGYPDDIECHSLTASESVILDRSGYDKIGLYAIDGVGTNPSCNGLYDFDKDLFLIKVNGTGDIVVGENYGNKTLDFKCENGATFDGTVKAPSFEESSDARLKTSIQPLNTSSLDNLTPVSFKWKSGDDRTHYGYIAQEVQPYFPELVSEGTDGMLGLAYTEIIPLLHCKIKEQQSKIESLEERITRLEELINDHT